MALSSFLTSFNNLYKPGGVGSSSGTNASCALCHDTTGGPNVGLNGYGAAFAAQPHGTTATNTTAFRAIEGMNSDNDPTGASNITEINASTQPGWTTGAHNTLYDLSGGVVSSNQSPPSGISGSLDPAAANQPPTANAGSNQAVQVGQTVQLNGSGSSDPEGHLLTYSWTITSRPSGSTAALTNSTTVNPTFVPDAAGTYTVQLVVNDGTQNSAPATVTITAAPAPNLPPVANAGPNQSVSVGATVTLDGSGSSDPERHALTYSWTLPTRPTGSTATLTNPTSVHPTFVADVAGNYVAQLVVNDGTQNSAPDTVSISAAAVNLPPVANAGPNQSVKVGQLVTLDGSASSDPEGQTLTYNWTFTSRPSGSTATLTNPTTVHPTFTPDVAGNYVVRLVVNDGTQNSTNTASVTIAATAANLPPVANAGPPQTVQVGATVTLNGTGSSDPEGSALTYSWAFVSRPTGSNVTLTNATSAHPTFTPDVAGQYVVGLVVNDGTLNSTNTANVVITATAAPSTNHPPVANAGPNQTVQVGATVQLDGSGSSDPDGNPLTYKWSFIARPTGSNATLSSPSAQKPTFGADVAGTYTVQLIVNDGTVDSMSATVVITAQAAPPATGGFGYSIASFTVTREIVLRSKTPVTFRLAIRNDGTTSGAAPVTLAGSENGVEVYRQTMQITAPIGTTATLGFQPYTPTKAGTIRWTVTIQEPSVAVAGSSTATAIVTTATAITEVERRGESRRIGNSRETSD